MKEKPAKDDKAKSKDKKKSKKDKGIKNASKVEKSSKVQESIIPERTKTLLAAKTAVDPALDALFASSAGPVVKPVRKERDVIVPPEPENDKDDEPTVDDAASESEDGGIASLLEKSDKKKKRKRKDEEDNLENEYFAKLEKEELKEAAAKDLEEKPKPKKSKKEDKEGKEDKKEKKENKSKKAEKAEDASKEKKDTAMADADAGSGSESGWDTESDSDSDIDTSKPIIHESLLAAQSPKSTKPTESVEVDKSQRTIFIGNVPSSVISTKSEYRTLKSTFTVCGPIESIRFRSIAFAAQIPRKAAYLTHKLHEKQTTINAYIVFKTKEAMRAALKLNGAVVLDRHLRVDSVAHPAEQDPKKCVFVGNLDFEAQEEMLWRHFNSCGKVESVRIVRDSKTNVGKGFAYVQFEDENAVEKALLLNDKKPSPKERKLRVVRARKVKKRQPSEYDMHPSKKGRDAKPTRPSQSSGTKKPTDTGKIFNPKADPAAASTLGRAKNLLGKAGAAQLKEQVKALEGVRASNSMPSGVKGAPKLRPLKVKGKKEERARKWKIEKAVKEKEGREKVLKEKKERKEKERREEKKKAFKDKGRGKGRA